MNIVLWTVAALLAALLAVVFVVAGAAKLALPPERLREHGACFVDDATPTQIRLLGLAEVLGGIGLVLPPLVGVAAWLAPLAALGLVGVMAGATVYHHRHQERIVPQIVLGVLPAFVAIGSVTFGF